MFAGVDAELEISLDTLNKGLDPHERICDRVAYITC